jgi:hypothetical protein
LLKGMVRDGSTTRTAWGDSLEVSERVSNRSNGPRRLKCLERGRRLIE